MSPYRDRILYSLLIGLTVAVFAFCMAVYYQHHRALLPDYTYFDGPAPNAHPARLPSRR